jgi:MFS family permease
MQPSPASSRQPWWRELTGYHWWVLTVATLGWLFDGLDQQLFVLAKTPALRELLGSPEAGEQYAGYATSLFICGWATGGLVFGILGDRWGRVRTMTVTILLYSLFTGLSALAHSAWEFAAYRFLCGMGIGGEYAAGVALLAEVMPDRARPYALGSLQALGALGHLGAAALTLLIDPQSSLGGFSGWRVLFLVGALPAMLVVVIRRRLREPESWLRARQQAEQTTPYVPTPALGDLGEIFRARRWRCHTLIGMLLAATGQIGLWGIAFWTPELIRKVVAAEQRPPDVQNCIVSVATMLQHTAGMLGTYAFTLFTARVGRRWAFGTAFLLAFAATLLMFGYVRRSEDVFWVMPLLGFCVAAVFGGYAVYFPELYPTRLRSTGTGFCYNVARYITALGPLALKRFELYFATLGSVQPLRPAAISLAFVYFVGVGTVFFAPETKDKPLPD